MEWAYFGNSLFWNTNDYYKVNEFYYKQCFFVRQTFSLEYVKLLQRQQTENFWQYKSRFSWIIE